MTPTTYTPKALRAIAVLAIKQKKHEDGFRARFVGWEIIVGHRITALVACGERSDDGLIFYEHVALGRDRLFTERQNAPQPLHRRAEATSSHRR